MSAAGGTNRSMGGASTAAPISAAVPCTGTRDDVGPGARSDGAGAELILPQARMSSFVPANTFGPGVPPIDLQGQTEAEDSVFAIPNAGTWRSERKTPRSLTVWSACSRGFWFELSRQYDQSVAHSPSPGRSGIRADQSEYQVVLIAPAIAWEVSEGWSVSFSPMLNIGKPSSIRWLWRLPMDANGDTFFTYPNGTHSRSSWGGGFGLGTYYMPGCGGLEPPTRAPVVRDIYVPHRQ